MRGIRWVIGLALLGGSLAWAAEWAYSDSDVRVQSPGADWNMQPGVPGAPNIRAAFVKPRGNDRGSILSLAIDATPDAPSPAAYAKRSYDALVQPPFSYKMVKTAEFTWKGNPAARAEFTDADGIRRFAQATIRTPRGGVLVVGLQSPDAASYTDDVKVFLTFLDRLDVPPPAKAGTP